ncbi:PAS domain-containing sensor histidine kinase [Nocardioides yefusunii]|uniref:Sensor-like histidine kinase SenX3 n=1 Tax=Nocardioides yefusunii TaxID=2500546 RepID=A0ABW1QYP8_9ACTN|nr:PAS domain-containing sensor histidine kinase [Nocardioides yefusunii]
MSERGAEPTRAEGTSPGVAPTTLDTPPPSSRAWFWAIWTLGLTMTTLFAVVVAGSHPPGVMPDVWLVATVAFTWLCMDWSSSRLLPRPTPLFLLTFACLSGIGVLTGVLMEASALDTLRSAAGIPLQAVVMGLGTQVTRRAMKLGEPALLPDAAPWRRAWAGWAPHEAIDLVPLSAGAVLSALFSLLVGSVPGVDLWSLQGFENVQWISHVVVVTVVGGSATLIIFSTWTPADLDQPWTRVIGVWLASVSLLLWVHSTGAVTMAWLQVIPTIIIALTCRVWVTALFSLLLGAVSVTLSPRLNSIEGRPGPVPLSTVMDLMVAALILVALTLAFLNRRRDDLMDDLRVERARTSRHLQVMETVFEAMQEGIVVVGENLTMRFHNSAAVELLGRPFPAERGGDWTAHFGLSTLDGRPVGDRDLFEVEHLVLPTPAGRRVLRQRTLRLSDQADDGVMVVLVDVTEQHQRMDELSGFAGVVAHDLRAPLTSLEGWLEMAHDSLQDGEGDDALVMLGRARSSNRRMRQIIDDWLNYTVQRQGTLHEIVFDLVDPVNAVVSQMAENGPHRFSIEVPHRVEADLATVRQVLANLVGNASKFSRPDTIPEIALRSHRTEPGWIRVDVEDRGIGLPTGQEEAIFDEYRRGTGPATAVEGFGLGLALCKRVVERHGGTIWARTNQHGGTTVSFTLPAAGAGPEGALASGAPASTPAPARRVLT